jgi:hypothetical protein
MHLSIILPRCPSTAPAQTHPTSVANRLVCICSCRAATDCRAHCAHCAHTTVRTATHYATHYCRTRPHAPPHTAARTAAQCRALPHCRTLPRIPRAHYRADCHTLPHTASHCRTTAHCRTAGQPHTAARTTIHYQALCRTLSRALLAHHRAHCHKLPLALPRTAAHCRTAPHCPTVTHCRTAGQPDNPYNKFK